MHDSYSPASPRLNPRLARTAATGPPTSGWATAISRVRRGHTGGARSCKHGWGAVLQARVGRGHTASPRDASQRATAVGPLLY